MTDPAGLRMPLPPAALPRHHDHVLRRRALGLGGPGAQSNSHFGAPCSRPGVLDPVILPPVSPPPFTPREIRARRAREPYDGGVRLLSLRLILPIASAVDDEAGGGVENKAFRRHGSRKSMPTISVGSCGHCTATSIWMKSMQG
jgi:hypothetical protein